MIKIEFKYRYGKDYVYCDSYDCNESFLYPIKNGRKLCCIARTNVIRVIEPVGV